MTNDQDFCDDSFQVVLIDIQKATRGRIDCVKMPLTDDLKYVAISYRWGELQETHVDTGVGYLASITSFDLSHFFWLCIAMSKEPDLRFMEYVWVDAICVNQSNHDERKATIYHMTDIYEHATWILAVPDLHKEHLKAMHFDVMKLTREYRTYLYHLLHGNTIELGKLDQDFLDSIHAPQDVSLRQLLTHHTDFFASGYMTHVERVPCFDDVQVLEHVYDIGSSKYKKKATALEPFINSGQTYAGILSKHQCDDVHCPVQRSNRSYQPYKEWGRCIIERGAVIRQAMLFLTDLVVDWSSRVWVISEFHISKKKNNLKFWFTQLNDDKAALTFFRFDVNESRLKTTPITNGPQDAFYRTPYPAYLTFYEQLTNQLNRQSIFEMMLKSKASKHEDRFYSIFPLFPEYKELLQSKELVNNVGSILTVKLKLYQTMTVEHKLILLALSSLGKLSFTLPTFATSFIDWSRRDDDELSSVHEYDITLRKNDLYYLVLKAPGFYISREIMYYPATKRALAGLLPNTFLPECYADVVWMCHQKICLFGSYHENIWIVGTCDYDGDARYISTPFEFHVY